MLQRQPEREFPDLSPELREPRQWKAAELRRLHFSKDITAFAYEPVTGLLAVGTSKGLLHIFGRPGVHAILTVTDNVSVKFLSFSVSTLRLACLGDDNRLFIWDLSSFGQPQFLASARFDQINCLLTSPSHSHVFLATHTGEIKTYDLLCLRKSPYTLPNLWDTYKRKIASSSVGREQSSRTLVEVVPHPRDLNLLFVAYAGGVVLSDLTQRDLIRAYEYTIPPGAPGGAGYGSSDVLTLRQPSVTCMAVHPAGHFFAVGYTDGSVAFWALEDEDQPLFVKTLEMNDVNIVDNAKLDHLLSCSGQNEIDHGREPVFKLSWSGFINSSDPRGGKTVLSVLGGLNAHEPPGLTAFELPAFHPSEPPPSPNVTKGLHPYFRSAMKDSLFPLKTYFYPTQEVVQDYLLVPRANPHYSGTSDPVAIIIMTGADTDMRRLAAFEFPPPAFKEVESDEDLTTERSALDPNELANELAATLRSLMESGDPRNLRTPVPLLISAAGLVNGHFFVIDRSTYQALTEGTESESYLNLRGGNAWTDATKENDMTFAKYQPPRLMATYNNDSTVRFFDISAQLLSVKISDDLKPQALEHEFPEPLPALTIDIGAVFGDPYVTSLVPVDKVPPISLMEFSPGCACAVAVGTGQLIVFRDGNSAIFTPCTDKELPDPELILLGQIKASQGKRHQPYCMVLQNSKYVEAVSIAGIGLLAVSYSDGTLLVVDMRIPRVILRHSQPKKKTRHSINFHILSEDANDPVVDLVWAVCAIQKDPQSRLHLLGIHLSSRVDIFTFTQDTGSTAWTTHGETITSEAIQNPLQRGNFVLDGKTGVMLKADRERLFLMTQHSAVESRCLFVTTGTKGARVYAGINGQRISKTTWRNDSGHIQSTQIVERMGFHALVAFSDKHFALVYSLPYLEHLHTIELPPILSLPPSIDTSGDFIAFSPHPITGQIHEAVYGTLFDFRRAYSPPDIELMPSPPTVPSQPQPIPVGPTSLLSAWFRFGLSMSGDQLDELLGGPQRPIPEPEPRILGGGSSQAADLATKAAAVQNEIYGRLTSAISERGHILEDLGERFNSLEAGSRSMVAQAKRLAAQQSAKSWFGL